MNIQVRTATERDVTALWQIQKAAFWPLYERYHDCGNPALKEESDIARRLDRTLYRCFCVLEEERLVGGVIYRCVGNGMFFDQLQAGEYYLQRVFIAPDRQSCGIASAAILMCEQQLPDARRIYVDFPEDLEKNRRCYEKAGFADSGKRKEIEKGLILAGFEKVISDAASFEM